MERIDYVIAGLLIVLVFTFSSLSPRDAGFIASSQAVGFGGTVSHPIANYSSYVSGFQSVAFEAAPQFSEDIITFKEGPSSVTKLWYGFPIWLYLMVVVVAAVNILLKYVPLSVKGIEEPDTLMKIANPTIIVLMIISVMYLSFLMTGGDYRYAVFYSILIIGPFGMITVLQQVFKVIPEYEKNFNFAVNDRILSWVDVTDKTQIFLIMFATIGIFILMAASKVDFAAFSASDTNMAVVLPEDRLWITIPTFLGMAISSVFIIGILNWLFTGKVSVDLSIIEDHKNIFFSGLAVSIILIGVFNGYAWAAYHKATYTTQATVIAAAYGISEDEAYEIITRSVSDFATYSTWGVAVSGSTLPADLVHGWVNWNA